MALPFRTLNDYFASVFPGKVQKIAVNAGLGCPNRDGTLGRDGCTYCSNAAFSPSYARGALAAQIEAGKKFFQAKGRPWGYLAYFQSFTGTYGPTEKLIGLYEEALACPDVVGLVIATRPDCLADDLLEYFRHRFGADAPEGHPYLLVELGVESTRDDTLERINRGHNWACAQEAVLRLHEAGIAVGAHLIIGLPGECEEDFIEHTRRLAKLPISTLKLHQLQIIKGTAMEREYAAHPEDFDLMTPERYASVVRRILEVLRPDIALDRFVSESPADMVIAPRWGLKPAEFLSILEREILTNMPLEELWELFPVTLVPHRDCWRDWFREEKSSLQKIFPQAIISHIGSTAVNGLMAKPIVDILMEFPSLEDMGTAAQAMESRGYIRMSDSSTRISLNKGYTLRGYAPKVFHLHLRLRGDNDEIRFRDILRSNPTLAKKYEELKISLAARYKFDRDAYTEGKTEFITCAASGTYA